MPGVSPKQVTTDFAKYQAEKLTENTTLKDIFTSSLEADAGAFDKYANDNNAAKSNQSIEEVKSSVNFKPDLSKAFSDYAIASKLPANAATEVVQLKKENVYQKTLHDTSISLKRHNAPHKSAFISYAWEDESTTEGREANEELQGWLIRLAKDLETVGIKVLLDIIGMQGKMSN